MVTWQVSPRDRMILDGELFEVIGEAEQFNHSPFGAMPSFPTPFTVGHCVHSAGGFDAHGNETDVWSEPIERAVHGWSAPRTDEPKLAGHDRDVVEVELLVPECRVINLRKVSG